MAGEDNLFDDDRFRAGSGYRSTIGYEGTDAERGLAAVPIIGAGVRASLDARRAEREAARNREYWDQLAGYMPSEDDLTVRYDEEGEILGGRSAWETSQEDQDARRITGEALDQLALWSSGGLTDTDREMMSATARDENMRARADREAALSSMEARGLGGSGVDYMSRLGAAESAAGRTSARNTSMLAAAQQRQLDATRARADVALALGASDNARQSGLDAWSANETGYLRGREGRNVERRNRSRDTAADAAQRVYENRERAVAGATNQYGTDVGRRSAEARRADDAEARQAGALGGLLEGLSDL